MPYPDEILVVSQSTQNRRAVHGAVIGATPTAAYFAHTMGQGQGSDQGSDAGPTPDYGEYGRSL